MKGKAQGKLHKRTRDRRSDQSIPTLSFDYGFATEKKRAMDSWKETEKEPADEEDTGHREAHSAGGQG